MGKKIYFQDGSAIEISTEILEPGEMATAAYRRIMEFLEDELLDIQDAVEGDDSESLDDLSEEDFEELDEDEDLMVDDDDDDEIALDDDEWDEGDDFDDRW